MLSESNAVSAHGHYYDGKTARAHTAELKVNSQGELELSPALRPPTAFDDIKISSRVGNTPRRIEFADGALFETSDHRYVDQWVDRRGGSPQSLHHLENKTAYALGALFLALIFITFSITWGIPWSSKYIAQAMPASITVPLGDSALASMDKLMFHPSKLPTQRSAELQAQFQRLLPTEESGYTYQLLFRGGGKMGPNAFALPNGTIIMTDELVALADFDEELQAIWLHEIGHLQHHHSLRQIIAHISLAVLTTTLSGDISAAGTLVAGVPNVLLEASFSREMETEADSYSLQRMRHLKLPLEHFANIMERLELNAFESEVGGQASDGSEADDNDSWLHSVEIRDFFSSHPLTGDRIARFRHGQPAPLPMPTAITDTNRYPVEVDKLRHLLASEQYAGLDKVLDDLYQSFLAGSHKAEIIADKCYALLTTLTPQTLDRLHQWAVAMPQSYAAHHAIGVYHANLINIRRDGRYWRNIPEQDLIAMADHTDSAVKGFHRSLELQPNFTLAQARLYSLASAGNDKNTDAKKLLADALNAHPASYILNEAKLFFLQPRWGGDYREMRRTLETITELAQQNHELEALAGSLHHYKAIDAFEDNNHHRAVQLATAAIKRGHKSWYFRRRAKAFNRLHQRQAALSDYDNAIRLFPEDPRLYMERSWIYYMQGRSVLAQKDIATTLVLAPYYTDALYGRAELQSETNAHHEALDSYQRILYVKPTEAQAHYLIGQLYLDHLNQPKSALLATRKALDFSPRQPSYWHQYARIQSSLQSCEFMSTAKIYTALCEEKNCQTKELQWITSNRDSLIQDGTCPQT